MDVKIKSLTFESKQHRIAHLHIGPLLRASEKVSMELAGPFVSCSFVADPEHVHLVPLSGISDVCVEAQSTRKRKPNAEAE